MYSMFCGCCNLTSINLSNFNTSKVVNMRSMFSDCNSLKSLELKNFDTSHVTEMSYMFFETHLTTLDLYHFNFSKLQNYGNMFDSCDKTLKYCLDNEKISSELKANIFSYFRHHLIVHLLVI